MITYKIKDIADEISIRVNNPKSSPLKRFVGLEHYISGNVKITNYGSTDLLDSAMKEFKSGDILIARRNVYLKRASVVLFDGLTSGDSIVLRAKSKEFQEILPFIFNTDEFWNYAIKHSDGSMSKRLSPKLLMEYEIALPNDINELHKISKVLWAIEATKAAQEELLVQTDELVKSQFIEMFGDLQNNTMGWELKSLSELVLIERGGSPRPIEKYITNSQDGVNWIKIGDATEGSIYITHTKEKIIKAGTTKSRYVKPGDFLLSNSMSFGRPYILMIDGYIHDGWLCLRDANKLFNKLFLHTLLSSNYAMISFDNMAAGSVVKNLNKELVGKLQVPVPPIKLQNEFAHFIEQTDKSKYHDLYRRTA